MVTDGGGVVPCPVKVESTSRKHGGTSGRGGVCRGSLVSVLKTGKRSYRSYIPYVSYVGPKTLTEDSGWYYKDSD